MGDNPAGKLLRGGEGVAYWAAVAPALARLPPALGYRIASWRGDVLFRCQAGKRKELARNVRLVLGDELSPAAAQQVVRGWYPAYFLQSGQRQAAAARGTARCSGWSRSVGGNTWRRH